MIRASKRTIGIVVAAVVVLTLGIVAFWLQDEPTATDPVPPTQIESSAPEASPPSSPAGLELSQAPSAPQFSSGQEASANPAAQGCTNPTDAFEPVNYTIERVGAHERVVPMSVSDGQMPAPPKNDRRSAAWWSGGPKPGADHGKVVLTIHTYRPSLSPALGNELYSGGSSALQPGDIIKMHGSNGEIACYEFTEAPKIAVSDYDPDSGIMVDTEGDPSLVIVICWDFNSSNSNWDSRVMFQFDLLEV